MNRRSFFGFACGGILAAPAAALVGERPANGSLARAEGIGPTVDAEGMPAYTIHIDGAQGDDHIRKLVQEGIAKADANRRHGGIAIDQTRYAAMKG